MKTLAEVYGADVTDLVKETMMPEDVSVIKSSAGALRQTSLQSQKELDEFLDFYNRLEDKHKVAVFNVTKTLYMDSV